MANQVVKAEKQAVVGQFTNDELNTMRQTIAKDTSDEQFKLFIYTCANSGLNPLLNHIYAPVYKGKMSIQVSVEGILFLARQKEGYKGIDVQTVHENDEFEASRGENGWVINEHKVKFPRGQLIGGYAIAEREGRRDAIVLMGIDEVEHLRNGFNKDIWGKYLVDMFKKHMTKRAAKLQFGIEITEDEPIGSSSIDETPFYERVDITPNKPNQIQVEEGETVDPEAELKKKQSEVMTKLSEYNMTNDDLQEIAFKHFKVPAAELNLQQLTGLVKFLGLEHKKRVKEQEKAQEQPEQEEIDFENMEMEIA